MKEEKDHHKEVSIVVDRKHFKLESPATGAELYALVGISGGGYDLYRETKGIGDDEFIQNNATDVILHPGDQFYTALSTLNPGGIV